MFKKLSFCVVILTIILSNAFATTSHYLSLGVNLDYELPSHEPQEFINSWFWPITSTCTILTKESAVLILIEMLKKSGRINGYDLPQGEHLLLAVHDHDKVDIAAESGSKVRITNQGMHLVIARCST